MENETEKLRRELEEESVNRELRMFVSTCPEDGLIYSIRDVYYYPDGTPEFFSNKDFAPDGMSVGHLAETLEMMKGALEKPAYDLDNFPSLYVEPARE